METTRSDIVVLFGATGDLACKQLIPALFTLHRRGELHVPVIGLARSALSDDEFRLRVRACLMADERCRLDDGGFPEEDFDSFVRLLSYLSGDYTRPDTYKRLDQALTRFSNPLFYMAIPPDMFERVTQGIKNIYCSEQARLVIEKPFGRSKASAQKLNQTLYRCFPEEAIFRADHFLAMESVANLMTFRFANMFMQPLWSARYIQHVQIHMAEDFGVAGRGSFYDRTGVVRDVVQNHLFQVLGLLAMEPPLGTGHIIDALHNAQLDIFRNIRPVQPGDVVFGQFEGYRQEPGVAENSDTATWVAMRLHVDTSRWRGVPFYIRTGKCQPLTCTEATVTLRTEGLPPLDEGAIPIPNTFRFRLFPDSQIAICAQGKRPGRALGIKTIELSAPTYTDAPITPYERVLADAIDGNHAVFTRVANMEAAWEIVDGILEREQPVHRYEAGSWGPPEADSILQEGDHWLLPVMS